MRGVISELVGLFLDDGFLAVALVGWCVAIGVARMVWPEGVAVLGPLLLAGCAGILLATVLRVRARR